MPTEFQKASFFGHVDMPTEFQKAMDYALIGLKNNFCFLDDIVVISKGSEEDHFELVTKCLKKIQIIFALNYQQVFLLSKKLHGNSINWNLAT